MTLLAILLLLDAAVHAAVIIRFGTKDKNNVPFLVFAFVDAALAIAVFLLVPYALWATLVLTILGLIGLTVTFGKPQRDKTLDKAIWVIDVVIVVYTAYLLFAV